MVDVRAVGQERALVVADAAEEYAHDIETRDHHRGKCQDEGIGVGLDLMADREQQLDAVDAEDETERQTARVAHEDLLAVVGLAEYVEVEEREQYAERGKGHGGIDVVSQVDEGATVKERCGNTQSRSKAVYTVDQVDRVDEEYDREDRKRVGHHLRQFVDTQQTVEVVDPYAARDQQHATKDLGHEFGSVFYTDQIVGNTDDIQQEQGAEFKRHLDGTLLNAGQEHIRIDLDVDSEDQDDAEEDDGVEGQTAQTRYGTLMDFAFVVIVEKSFPKGNEQNFWDYEACQEHADHKHG